VAAGAPTYECVSIVGNIAFGAATVSNDHSYTGWLNDEGSRYKGTGFGTLKTESYSTFVGDSSDVFLKEAYWFMYMPAEQR